MRTTIILVILTRTTNSSDNNTCTQFTRHTPCFGLFGSQDNSSRHNGQAGRQEESVAAWTGVLTKRRIPCAVQASRWCDKAMQACRHRWDLDNYPPPPCVCATSLMQAATILLATQTPQCSLLASPWSLFPEGTCHPAG
jgi:hypothetical protein